MASYIVTDRIRVNIVHSFAVPPRVKCEQYDGDYTKLIQAIVYNGDVLYSIPSAVRRIVVSGLKPDGNGFSYDCTWSGNTVSFSLMRQMTAVDGKVPCNITMFDASNNQVSSAVFVLDVEKAALPSDVVVSSNDFQTFVDYVQAANLYWQYSKSYAVGNTGVREDENVDNAKYYAHLARMYKGSPLTASTISEMIDTERVYVYTGSESGYNNGHWYFYDDTTWVDGGVYNSEGIQTDTELIAEGVAADAKAVGDILGHEPLTTTSQTFSGAINELNNFHFNSFVSGLAISTKVKVGDYVKTDGYYEADDGGGALYRVVDESTDYTIPIANELYAKYVEKSNVNAGAFGAIGNNDTILNARKAIAYAKSVGANIIFPSDFTISDSLEFDNGFDNKLITFLGNITFTGSSYAIILHNTKHSIVRGKNITASVGSGVELLQNGAYTLHSTEIHFQYINADNNCVALTASSWGIYECLIDVITLTSHSGSCIYGVTLDGTVGSSNAFIGQMTYKFIHSKSDENFAIYFDGNLGSGVTGANCDGISFENTHGGIRLEGKCRMLNFTRIRCLEDDATDYWIYASSVTGSYNVFEFLSPPRIDKISIDATSPYVNNPITILGGINSPYCSFLP